MMVESVKLNYLVVPRCAQHPDRQRQPWVDLAEIERHIVIRAGSVDQEADPTHDFVDGPMTVPIERAPEPVVARAWNRSRLGTDQLLLDVRVVHQRGQAP